MFKQNSGCGIFGIILCLIAGIVLAFDGNFQYLIYLILFISIPLFFIYFMGFFSSDQTKVQQAEIKDHRTVKEPQKTTERKFYRIKKNELTGSVEGSILPADIRNLQNLDTIRLSTDQPIEISGLINQNQNLKYLSLSGPFWLKDKVTPRILNLSLNNQENISEILERFINHQKLQVLTIRCRKIDIEDVCLFSRNIRTLTLRSELQEFPYELINLPSLQVLDLSNNGISRISDKKLERTNIQRSKLQVLNLSKNHLNTVPLTFFCITSLGTVILKGNPIAKRSLKRLQRDYFDKISLSYDQNSVATRTFHPKTWILIKILISFIIILAPYLLFDSPTGSFLVSIFVVSAWRIS